MTSQKPPNGRKQHRVNLDTCPSFNAPSGLRWRAGYVFIDPNDHSKGVEQRVWMFQRNSRKWIYISDDGTWTASDFSRKRERKLYVGTLHECARALVAAVRGAQ